MTDSNKADRRRTAAVTASLTEADDKGAGSVALGRLLMIEDVMSQARVITAAILDEFPDATISHEQTLAGGIAAATRDSPQIILCDLGLEDSAGTATIERLRHAVPNVPIVAMTSGDHHGLECLLVGADDFLDKQDITKKGALQRTFTFTLTRWYRQAEVQYLAQHDYLTSLLSRSAVQHRYLRLLSNAREAGYHIGLVLADLNYFKAVNDVCGHEAGDTVLKEYAEAFEENFRQLDIVGRWGGDEFVAVVALAEPEHIGIILSRLEQIGIEYQDPSRNTHTMTATYGSAVVPASASPQLDELMRAADSALLEAKRSRATVPAQPAAVPEPVPATGGKPHILMIEDNEMDAVRTTQALNQSEVAVDLTTVDRAERAQELLRAGEGFDLILLDLNLPGINGHEFLLWIKDQPHLRHIPVVVLSSSAMHTDTDSAWAEGSAAYLTKAASHRSLVQDVDDLLKFYFRLSRLPVRAS